MTDVLFVDDDPFILNALRRLMRREDFTIKTAAESREALEILESEDIPVVVSDYMMPEMNGVELLGEARKRRPSVTRVILSGYADKEVISAALASGVVHQYLLKPWNDEELKRTVRDLVEQSKTGSGKNLNSEGI